MKELQKIQSELKAPKNQTNAFGKYKYRSCEDIMEAVKPLMNEANCHLTVSDEMVLVGERVYVKATAILTSSDGATVAVCGWAREAESKKGMDSAQVTGATSSYARKYALNGLFAIDDTKDADATNDHGKSTPNPKAIPAASNKGRALLAIRKASTQDELSRISLKLNGMNLANDKEISEAYATQCKQLEVK
jgi:hypothetical protein